MALEKARASCINKCSEFSFGEGKTQKRKKKKMKMNN